MKTSEQYLNEESRLHTEAVVDRHVRQMFRRLPMLVGFWMRPDLELAELSIFTWPGYVAGRDLYDVMMQLLVELGETCPEALQLMRGRTYARAIH